MFSPCAVPPGASQTSRPAASVVPRKSVSQARSLDPRRTLPSTTTSAPATGCALPSAVTTKTVRSGSSSVESARSVTCRRIQLRTPRAGCGVGGVGGVGGAWSHPPQADEVGARRPGAGEPLEVRREIEAERRRGAVAAQRQIDQHRNAGRTERRDLLREASGEIATSTRLNGCGRSPGPGGRWFSSTSTGRSGNGQNERSSGSIRCSRRSRRSSPRPATGTIFGPVLSTTPEAALQCR